MTLQRIPNLQTAIIIVAYNNEVDLDNCLKSIVYHEPNLSNIDIVVVDHSTTEAVSQVITSHHPYVIYSKHENRGYGAGNNIGSRLTRAEILLFLNPDTAFTQAISGKLSQAFEKNPMLGALGGRLVYEDGSRQQSFFWANGGGIAKGLTQHILNRTNTFLPTHMCTSGAALAVRAEAFQQVNGFDPQIFLYNEEADLWNRVKQSGWLWGYDPKWLTIHIGGGSTPGSIDSTLERLRSLEYYCTKYEINYTRRVKLELRYERLSRAVHTMARLFARSDKYTSRLEARTKAGPSR